MQTADAQNLFQTDAAIEQDERRQIKSVRAAKLGDPIVLSSKIIKLEVRGQDAWTAESGWVARRTDLRVSLSRNFRWSCSSILLSQTGKTKRIFKDHKGPCTALAFLETPQRTLLLTGAWDKTIKVWDTETGALLSTTLAHGDFIKSLLVMPQLGLLVSGSSDKLMNVWDLSDPTSPLKRLASVKEHTRPVECMAIESEGPQSTTFFTGDSMGSIRRWSIGKDGKPNVLDTLPGHQTSVTQLQVVEGGLWSASVDKTVLFHPLPHSDVAPSPIQHPDYVKSLLVVPTAFHPDFPLLLTGSTDEDIRVFDVSELVESNGNNPGIAARALKPIVAHYLEVTALRPWLKDGGEQGKKEAWIVSSSLDNTLRRWRMAGESVGAFC